MKNKKSNNKGFTLLELLVVVLIIGILAAIALPQYRLAVAKSQYATLKNVTKSLKESVDRYFLTNGTYPRKFADLDIDLGVTKKYEGSTDSFYIEFPGVSSCEVYYSTTNRNIICQKIIAKKYMNYVVPAYPWTKKVCSTRSLDTNDIPNRVCQAETGKKASQASCSDTRCQYYY